MGELFTAESTSDDKKNRCIDKIEEIGRCPRQQRIRHEEIIAAEIRAIGEPYVDDNGTIKDRGLAKIVIETFGYSLLGRILFSTEIPESDINNWLSTYKNSPIYIPLSNARSTFNSIWR